MPRDQDQFAAPLSAFDAGCDTEAQRAWAAWRASMRAALPESEMSGSRDEDSGLLKAALRLAFEAGFRAGTLAAPIEQNDLIAQVLLEVRALRRLVLRAAAVDEASHAA